VIFCTFLFLSVTIASCQKLYWKDATNWTLYRYQGHRLFKIPLDSLQSYDHLSLDQDSILAFMDSVQLLNPKGAVAWMGGYIATCKLNGIVRKVEFSNYGGFFFDEKTRTYYTLPSEKTEDWITYLQQQYLSLTRKQQ